MLRKIFLIHLHVFTWLLALPAIGQGTNQFAGRVITVAGVPLESATVQLRKTRAQAVTDVNGKFILPLRSLPDTLVVSYTGYATIERPVLSYENIEIVMQQASGELAGVIVQTGYQSLPKERATGSFVHLNNELINKQVTANIMDRLEAVAGSLSVDRRTNSPNVMVRGLSTIQGPRGPLIVLDNFPYNGNINNINPNDIESITILKDAAASSIWGTKAGNGVIVITTKKASARKPFSLDLNTNVQVASKPDVGYIRQMGSNDFVNVEEFLFSKGFYNSQVSSRSRPPLSPVIEALLKHDTSSLTTYRAHDMRSDLDRYFYRHAVNQQYWLTASGGNEIMGWLASGGLDRDMDALSAAYNRVSLKLQNNWQPVKGMRIEAGLAYTASRNVSGKPGYYDLLTANGSLPPYTFLTTSAGDAIPVMKDYRQTYLDTAGAGRLLDWNYYPITDYKHNIQTTSLQDLLANLSVYYTMGKGFSASVRYQYERQANNSRALYDTGSYFTRSIINLYMGAVPMGSIADVNAVALESQQARLQVNYDHSWGQHRLSAICGAEIRDMQSNGYAFRTYGYNDEILTTGKVDMTVPYPTYVSGAQQFIPDNSGFSFTDNRFVSLFANGAYTYKQKYTVSLGGRRDASNLFGVSTNDKWAPLWSAGLAWRISNALRARVTYGTSGNADPSRTAVTTISYLSSSPYTGAPYARFDKYANTDLRWENVASLNIGIDATFLNGRIAGSLEYYHKKGTGLFGTTPIDYTTGVGAFIVKNVASMSGNGLDLQLATVNVQSSGLRWATLLNLSYYKDRVTRYYLPATSAASFVTSTSPRVTGLVGKPVYAVMAYRWAGLDPQTGDPQGYLGKDISKDYRSLTGSGITDSDLVYAGPALPVLFGTLNNTFVWKSLSLDIGITYKFGYYFRRPAISYSKLFTSRSGDKEYAERWQQPGDEKRTNVPSMVYPANTARDNFYNGSEVTVDKGDNIRLQYITIGYTIPKHAWQFYINLNNIGILWRANKDRIDPDYPTNALPSPMNMSFGLRAHF